MGWLSALLNHVGNIKAAFVVFISIGFSYLIYPHFSARLKNLSDVFIVLGVFLFSFASAVIVVGLFEKAIDTIQLFLSKRTKVKRLNQTVADRVGELDIALPHLPSRQRVLLFMLCQGELNLEINDDVRNLRQQGYISATVRTGDFSSVHRINPIFKAVVISHQDSILCDDYYPFVIDSMHPRELALFNAFYFEKQSHSDEDVINIGNAEEIRLKELEGECCLNLKAIGQGFLVTLNEGFGAAVTKKFGRRRVRDSIHVINVES